MPELKLYNSLSRKKETFQPIDPGHVKLYACGPTVYNYAHIGNARMAVIFDLLADILRRLYPKVTYASNITDVDDKIMAAAIDSHEVVNPNTQQYPLTLKFEKIYNEDMAALGIAKPDVQPRATEHIPEMIALIEKLIARGHAYESERSLADPSVSYRHVLFHVPSFEKYGGLSGRSRDEQIAGARVDVAPNKKDPADFVLWKPSTHPNLPGWDSPWGRGRPGWHIECSAMAEKHLGLPFDIHGGGADLKFPHHENEIAQSCCAHGHDNDLSAFAKTWVHNGFVTVNGEKMSKSLGNFMLVHDLIKEFPGEVLRLTLLSAHYTQPLDFSEDKLVQAKKNLNTLYSALNSFSDLKIPEEEWQVYPTVLEALMDDLNTPLAISRFLDLANAGLTFNLEHKRRMDIKSNLLGTGRLLGILQSDPAKWLGYDVDESQFEKLLAERTAARAAKNFRRSDEIRDELAAQGYAIEDTAQGPKLRKIN